MNAEKNSIVEPVSLPSPVRTTALRSKRNRVVEKELCEIASELFSSRYTMYSNIFIHVMPVGVFSNVLQSMFVVNRWTVNWNIQWWE